MRESQRSRPIIRRILSPGENAAVSPGRALLKVCMPRLHQWLLIGSFLPLCWLGMMAVHEFGHVAAGWASGGEVTKVVVHPLSISRTDLGRNPRPLLVAWAGPIVGVVLPLAAWQAWRLVGFANEFLWRFFAGFCAIANGCYLGVGAFTRIGDAGDLVRLGAPPWLLVVFGAIAAPLGLAAWHGLGGEFGIGSPRGLTNPRSAYWSLALCLIAWGAALLFSPRN